MKHGELRFHPFELILLLLATLAIAGCIHQRTMCVASVGDVGLDVKTKYRYCFKDEKLRNSGDFMKLKRAYPSVFADDGIPFTIQGEDPIFVRPKKYGWTLACPYACSLLTLPMFNTSEWSMNYVIDLVDIPDAHTEFSSCFRHDHAFAMWTPSPLLFYIGTIGDLGDETKYKGCRTFSARNVQIVGNLDIIGDSQGDSLRDSVCNPFMNAAYAYGLAVSLKKMEDAGLVDLWMHENRNIGNDKDSHIEKALEILDFGREDGSDYAYRFKMHNRRDMSLREVSNVRKMLVKTIRDDYLASNPYVAASMLVVDFPVYNLKGADVEGRAVVLRLNVCSLNYDPNTRRGIMKIRLDEGQFAEARDYVRRNVEMMVRDKGIALETGKIPEEATFRLLNEKMSNGLFEVAFIAE